tara:strand:- start:1001 stop:1492 length:492 start_codon:yes stop_codon:yes gene_type:complete
MPNKKTTSKTKTANKQKAKIKELEKNIIDKEEKYLRLLAEFDNYKKRKNLEIDNLIKYEGFGFFKSMLSIMDDIDRTLDIKDVKKNKSIFDGFSMIKNKIMTLLDKKEIIAYDSVNQVFDSAIHEAVMVKKSSKKSNTIIEEFEKGYNYKDKVLRHAKVVVSE